jgi:very-short-patch-repair endonuclease
MGPFVLDFFCFEAGLVVELDGPCHLSRKDRDRRRDQWLESLGLTVLRLTNEELLAAPEQAVERIRRQLAFARPPLPLLFLGERRGEGAGG